MKQELLDKALDLKSKINDCNSYINTIDSIIKLWQEQGISSNRYERVLEGKAYRFKEPTTRIQIIDNSINLYSIVEIPIEALTLTRDYHKDRLEQLEKEFEAL